MNNLLRVRCSKEVVESSVRLTCYRHNNSNAHKEEQVGGDDAQVRDGHVLQGLQHS